MFSRAAYLMTIVCTAALLTGCGNALSGSAAPSKLTDDQLPGLVPQSKPLVTDLPTPIGFVLVEPLSSHSHHDGKRKIKYTFHGPNTKPRVDRFYANQMPLKGWTETSRDLTLGTYRLSFTKDNERCDIRIGNAIGISRNRTSVTVRVAPIEEENSLIPNLNLID